MTFQQQHQDQQHNLQKEPPQHQDDNVFNFSEPSCHQNVIAEVSQLTISM